MDGWRFSYACRLFKPTLVALQYGLSAHALSGFGLCGLSCDMHEQAPSCFYNQEPKTGRQGKQEKRTAYQHSMCICLACLQVLIESPEAQLADTAALQLTAAGIYTTYTLKQTKNIDLGMRCKQDQTCSEQQLLIDQV